VCEDRVIRRHRLLSKGIGDVKKKNNVRDDKRDDALGQGELGLVGVLVGVVVALLVVLEHGFVDTVVLNLPPSGSVPV
jgi:hypothetical protein